MEDPFERPREPGNFFENPMTWLAILAVALTVAVGAYIAYRDAPDQPAPTTTSQPRR